MGCPFFTTAEDYFSVKNTFLAFKRGNIAFEKEDITNAKDIMILAMRRMVATFIKLGLTSSCQGKIMPSLSKPEEKRRPCRNRNRKQINLSFQEYSHP